MFGYLTDPMDWPGHEAEVPAAEAKIRLAAGDWLALAKDRKGVDQFLDRRLFEVLANNVRRSVTWTLREK